MWILQLVHHVSQHLVHQNTCTPDDPYTRTPLHRNLYTRGLPQQDAIKQETLYVKELLWQTAITPADFLHRNMFTPRTFRTFIPEHFEHEGRITLKSLHTRRLLLYTLGFSTEALHTTELLYQNTLGGVRHMFFKTPVLMAKWGKGVKKPIMSVNILWFLTVSGIPQSEILTLCGSGCSWQNQKIKGKNHAFHHPSIFMLGHQRIYSKSTIEKKGWISIIYKLWRLTEIL